MVVSIHQPNFLPWIGLFHKISLSDIFISFDDVQFPVGKSFGNRVLIRNFNNSFWINIPVEKKSGFLPFNKIHIKDDGIWKKKLIKKIEFSYQKASFFEEYFSFVSDLINTDTDILSEYNLYIIEKILCKLNIKTKIIRSSEVENAKEKAGFEKINTLIQSVKADTYISGRGKGSAKYINEELMNKAGVKLVWQSFNHPVYKQVGSEFINNLSVIDLLFNEGSKSSEIIKNS